MKLKDVAKSKTGRKKSRPSKTNKSDKKLGKKIIFGLGALFLAGSILCIVRDPVGALQKFLQPVSVFSKISGVGSLEQTDGRTNILLLGADRSGGQDSRGLTDTVMVASVDLKKQDMFVLSIPRDLWVEPASGKINSIYALQGAEVASEFVGKILGLPIHYYVVMDFEGFVEAIDILGGVEVNVENTFDDYFYPIPGREDDTCGLVFEVEPEQDETESSLDSEDEGVVDSVPEDTLLNDFEGILTAEEHIKRELDASNYPCRFESLHFDAGVQTMDGETALKYARSRHAPGPEGTDFARSRRQQNVIAAVREKSLSSETLLNPRKLKVLYNTFVSSIETNIGFSQAQQLVGQSVDIPTESIRTAVLNQGAASSLLIIPEDSIPYGGMWVLVPRVGDFSEIMEYMQEELFGEK